MDRDKLLFIPNQNEVGPARKNLRPREARPKILVYIYIYIYMGSTAAQFYHVWSGQKSLVYVIPKQWGRAQVSFC